MICWFLIAFRTLFPFPFCLSSLSPSVPCASVIRCAAQRRPPLTHGSWMATPPPTCLPVQMGAGTLHTPTALGSRMTTRPQATGRAGCVTQTWIPWRNACVCVCFSGIFCVIQCLASPAADTQSKGGLSRALFKASHPERRCYLDCLLTARSQEPGVWIGAGVVGAGPGAGGAADEREGFASRRSGGAGATCHISVGTSETVTSASAARLWVPEPL